MSPQTRALVFARCGGLCEACGTPVSEGGFELHHRRARGMGGTADARAHGPANLLALCASRPGRAGCHRLVHDNPLAARRAGLLVHSGADPARVAVTLHDGRRVLLSGHGTYDDQEE